MILVDTSVWIEHFRVGNDSLVAALDAVEVLMHSFVIGELACGNFNNRREALDLLAKLPPAPVATESEALAFIERHSLMGTGIGYIDVHLLAATALLSDAKLWTHDKRLAGVAADLSLAYT